MRRDTRRVVAPRSAAGGLDSPSRSLLTRDERRRRAPGTRPSVCDYHGETLAPFEINHSAAAVAEASVVVDSPPERVWYVLTAIDAWPEWQRSVSRARLEGPLEPGSTFRWKGGGLSIVSTLRVVEPPREVAWEGRARGVYVRHVWRLERTDGGTRVETAESLEGTLVRVLRPLGLHRSLEKAVERGLAALKREAEARAG